MLGRNSGYNTTQGQVSADLLSQSGYTVYCASSKKNRLMRMADIIATILQNRRAIDLIIVEVYSGLSFVVADVVALLAKYLKIPSIGVLHGGDLPRFCQEHPQWTDRALRRFDRLASPSGFLAEAIVNKGLSAEVIPNIIDIEKYPFRQRSRLGPRILWMRAFHEIYQPELALKVFIAILKQFPSATLIMAGPDKGLADITKRLAIELGISEAISFPGFLDYESKLSAFSSADIFLNTTRVDNMPVAVVEACAMGLPVVATNVGGLRHLITDGDNGLLVPGGNAAAMADAVTRLLSEPDLAYRLSKNGRKLAEKSAWLTVRPQWESLFAEVLHESKPETKPSTIATA